MNNTTISRHAHGRMQNRHINDVMIAAAREFGEKIYAQNSLYYFLGRRALKRLMQQFIQADADHWEGLTLVCDPVSGTLITCFRNKNWLKKIRPKK